MYYSIELQLLMIIKSHACPISEEGNCTIYLTSKITNLEISM